MLNDLHPDGHMKPNTDARRQASVGKVLSYLAANLNEPCTLRCLSRVACFAPFHFHRVFREATGVPVQSYVRRLRLERSVYLLLFSHRSIIEIALEVGYQSNEAFTRAFQRDLGVSPSRFRAAYGAARRGVSPGSTVAAAARALTGGLAVESGAWEGGPVGFLSWFGHRGEIPRWWTALRTRLSVAGMDPASVRAVGVGYDDPSDPRARIRYDTCVVLPRAAVAAAGLGMQCLPSLAGVTLTHQGPLETTVHAFMRLSNTVRVHARPVCRFPYFELFRGFPDRSGVEVDVCFPFIGEQGEEPADAAPLPAEEAA